MAFFKLDTSEDNVRDYTGDGGKWLNKSGIFDLVIKAVTVNATANGSEFLNLWVEHEGQEQPLFQAIRMTNNDGSVNLGQQLFSKLCVIAGASNGQEIGDPVSRMLPMGKDKETVECMVLEEFDDLPVTIRLQMEYSMYEGKIQQNKNIRNFFRYEDKATASEIVNNAEDKGKQFQMEQELADKVVYKDDLTEENIKEWQKNQKSGKKDAPAKPRNGFGQKRQFGKKVA